MSDIDKKLQILNWKIKNDRQFYMENFLKIRDKKAQLISFKVNEAQTKFLEIINENTRLGKPHRYIILKARQLGFSTFTEGFIFHATATSELINSLIIAHEDKATQNLFNMSKLFYEELPASLRPMKKYSNEKALVFENPSGDEDEKQRNPGLRSKITVATAGTSDTARSGTYHNVHVSEIAFFPNPKNTMTALLQCVPDEPNTFVCMESTANGIGGYFYDMWNDAVEGKNDFTPLFFPWFTDSHYSTPIPEDEFESFLNEINRTYKDSNGQETHTEEWLLKKQFDLTDEQLYWRKKTIANKCGGDLDMFKQEYPATPDEAFIASGRPKFNLKSVKEYELNCVDPTTICYLEKTSLNTVKKVENKNGYVRIYREPEKDGNYTIGADVAEGLINGDYSVATVLDGDLNVVAKWRGHIDPDLFGKELVKLGYYYNEAYLAIENNNHGLTTLKSVLNEGYYNVYYSKIYDKINDQMTQKLGWSTNVRTKPLMIDKLAEYIRERFLGIKDIEIVLEMYSYVIDDKGKTNAQQGKHDDCIMSLAIALQAFLEGRGNNYIPEQPKEMIFRFSKKQIMDTPEIIDELFEGDGIKEEYT